MTTRFVPGPTDPAPPEASETEPAQTEPAQTEPAWARPALYALLIGTGLVYLINLGANGWANSFYSAAVQAGSQSWQAFFFGSLDAANSITVDKPPAALWVMALSVRLFGLNTWAILVPQVLMAVGAVGALYATVRRAYGARAGLLAGLVLALTPVAALMFRFNNPDALLTLLMTLAAWATLRAVEEIRFRRAVRWMAIAGVFLGFGFLTKTLQVMLVVPALGLAWLLAARAAPLGRRLGGGLVGIAATVLSAGWWVAIVELTPAGMRPYIGGSQTNSFLELTFGYNGLGRLNGEETGSVTGGGGGGGMWGETGIGRLFSTATGGQTSWLIPAALVLSAAALVLRGRAPRTDLRRAGHIVWGGWLLVTMITFSFMAGIFHDYYTVALAPAIAALIGMGAAEAWEHRATWLGRSSLAVAVAMSGAWGFVLLSRTTEYPAGLRYAVLLVGLGAGLALLAVHRMSARLATGVVVASIIAGLAGPAAYTATTIAATHTGSIVTAGPSTGGGPGGRGGAQPGQNGTAPQRGTRPDGGGAGGLLDAATPSAEVVAALEQDADSYTWIAATVGSQSAAGLQLATELPVMAIGGFNGSDPSPTLAQFQEYVSEGTIHYFVAGMQAGRQNGGAQSGTEISSWVQANFTEVTIGDTTMYDLSQPVASSAATPTLGA